MSGAATYDNKYETMARNSIAKYPKEWLLSGFYNSMIVGKKKSYSTAYLYLSFVIRFLKGIDVISNICVDDYTNFLVTYNNKSSSVQIDAFHALQKYSKYLRAKNICDDYMLYVERPKTIHTQAAEDKREKGYLTKSEAKKLIANVSNRDGFQRDKDEAWKVRDIAMISLFLNTGMRCSALYKLDLSDIDTENNTVKVLEKGMKYRVLNISDATMAIILNWISYRNLMPVDKKETALFISNRMKRMETQTIRKVIKTVAENTITDKNITPHKLRATFGTQLYNKTHDLYFVQACMGHSSPKTTEIYIRGQKSEASKKAADLMDGFLN